MPVLKDRRFRDMRLTEEEVEAIVSARAGYQPSLPKREKRLAKAKRLLPLWREWGLRNLYRAGIAAGETMVYDIEPEELDP